MTLPDPNAADSMPQPDSTRETRVVKRKQIIREIEPPPLPELPEPASYAQVLVALSEMDPLGQEVLIAQRLASMPSQNDGSMPVNIPRMVRGPWAHHLRKLGIFCIPELATHELVANGETGVMANHTAASMRQMTPEDMWDVAKAHNPELAKLVDNAKTPEEKQKAMRILASKLPVEQRIAMEKLAALNPDNLAPS